MAVADDQDLRALRCLETAVIEICRAWPRTTRHVRVRFFHRIDARLAQPRHRSAPRKPVCQMSGSADGHKGGNAHS